MLRLAVIAVVAALFALPPAAVVAATPNPFIPAPEESAGQEAAPTEPVPQTLPAQEDDASLEGGTVTLLAIGILGLIGSIWWVIARDARRATAGRVRVRTARDDPLAVSQGRSATRASPKSRKVSQAEKRRRKRGRAR